jgi:hypothetical protein
MIAPDWLQPLFAAVDRRDAEAFVTFLTDDAVFRFGNAEGVAGRTAIREAVDGFFQSIGRQTNVIVNYDNFNLNPNAADAFYAMVRQNTARYFLSSTRYSTHAFFRRKLAAGLDAINLQQEIYRSFDEAREGLG